MLGRLGKLEKQLNNALMNRTFPVALQSPVVIQPVAEQPQEDVARNAMAKGTQSLSLFM